MPQSALRTSRGSNPGHFFPGSPSIGTIKGSWNVLEFRIYYLYITRVSLYLYRPIDLHSVEICAYLRYSSAVQRDPSNNIQPHGLRCILNARSRLPAVNLLDNIGVTPLQSYPSYPQLRLERLDSKPAKPGILRRYNHQWLHTMQGIFPTVSPTTIQGSHVIASVGKPIKVQGMRLNSMYRDISMALL